MIPGESINRYKNCIICGNSIEFDHHFGRCWECVCKERLKYYEEGLKIYEKLEKKDEYNIYKSMVKETKKEIEKWKLEIEFIRD